MESTSRVFATLADPERRLVLAKICRLGPISRADLHEKCELDPVRIDYQTGKLSQAGVLLKTRVDHRVSYRVNPESLATLAEFFRDVLSPVLPAH